MTPQAAARSNDLILQKSRVSGTTKRALFRSKKYPGLWYAETHIPDDNNSKPDPNPYTWDVPPRKINLSNARPTYKKGAMTSAKYATKGHLYAKQMDYLRYYRELFGHPYWIKDIMTREIANCEMLRKNPHPNICRYVGVNYGMDQVITALLFRRYDTTLWDLIVESRVFDAENCIQGIRKGIQHIHSLGYVHCDIKPPNIFVDTRTQSFVVGDFDSMQKQGASLKYKCGTDGWALDRAGTSGYMVNVEQDWFGFDMVSAWVREKGNGKPVQGGEYAKTDDILARAKRAYEVKRQAEKLRKQTEDLKMKAEKVRRQQEVKRSVKEKADAVRKVQAAKKVLMTEKAKIIPKADALEKIEAAKKAVGVKPTYANVVAKRDPEPTKKLQVPKKLRVQSPS
ncbi:hypothetical protein J4E93_009565 [Alternaria ventricosa]|uniref:uncharacterized protein n=1 Tax=Alternaria ventricosa TaxID=1187951 RepID=UPI0020C1E468|nr:uncharacterized protein J4E93_009565 [Alternaria ventricosa]KAI4639075.1 hypothetical protein J4E93_009565 [Alternaria ventricosa]